MDELPAASHFRERKSYRLVALLAAACLFALILTAITLALDWTLPRKIAPHGGIFFFRRVEIAVPQFRQGDPRWRDDPLGATPGKLGSEGCAVASAAMVLRSYGIEIDPQSLNTFLTNNEGYVGTGWLVWEKAAEFQPGIV